VTEVPVVGDIRVRGLRHPVEIVVDTWGIPHIFAESAADAFLAQGFNAARDRLFQIDLWRRRGLGRLAEAFGPAYVEHDHAARLFLYRGDMAREWAAYGSGAEAAVTSFTAGINAYLDWLADRPEAMPPEFALLDYVPERWEPADVVRVRSHGIAHNLLREVIRADTTSVAGWKADQLRQEVRPPRQPHLADGLDLDLPADLLRLFDLATQPLVFAGDRRPPLGHGEVDASAGGSNNWAVSASRTTTGRPLLASDPHRIYSVPSLRYIAHLSAPDLDVIGAGEPALPGVTLGHNGHVAFGFTIFPVDVQDLYVYELDPTDPTRYRYDGGWESFRSVAETCVVRGGTPRHLELAFTRHGPVIYTDVERHRAYAVRSTWDEPGTAAYLGSLRNLTARTSAEFKSALREWGSPGENHVFADVDGTIGWQAAGLVPKRPGWDGLLPVPGDGRYEWDGFYTSDDMPSVLDPADGFVATANEFNLPDDFPPERHLSYEWPDPSRHERIVEVLAATDQHAIKDSMLLQNDLLSVGARDLLPLVAALATEDRAATAAQALLAGWDAVESADSSAAALYEVWFARHLMPAFVGSVLPEEKAYAVDEVDPEVLRQAMLDPERWWGARGPTGRDALLVATLRGAYVELERLLGKDPDQWSWGRLHPNLQRHPLGFLDPSLDMPRVPVGGSGATVNAAPYFASDLVQRLGASFRMVVDVGGWDNSVAINTPGQSGDPRSPHYRDLLELWRRGDYVPLLYTRAAVEENAETRIRLLPG
jgi:penicillin G amidase